MTTSRSWCYVMDIIRRLPVAIAGSMAFRRQNGWFFLALGGGGLSPGFKLLLQLLQFLAQIAVGLFQIQDFLAQVFEVVHWFADGAQIGDRALGGDAFRAFLCSAGKFLHHAKSLGITQCSKRA